MVKKILLFALHLVAIAAVAVAWWIFAQWYLNYSPLLGVDFYNTASYTAFFSKHFVFLANAWKYFWWSGHTFMGDYPTLHFYGIAILVPFWGLITSIKFYMLGSLLLLFVSSYLLFWQVSKNLVLSVVLSVAAVFSIGMYGALVWGGSLPYFATQAFLPLALFLYTRYLSTKNKKYFYLSALVTGISIFGHPQVAIVYILPYVFILQLLWVDEKLGLFSWTKIRDLGIFAVVVLLISYVELASKIGVGIVFLPFWFLTFGLKLIGTLASRPAIVNPTLSSAVTTEPSAYSQQLQIVNNSRIELLLKETNPILVYGAIIALAALLVLLILPKRKPILKIFAFVALVIFNVGFVIAYANGFNLFQGGWYRVFWTLPILLGLLISGVWKEIYEKLHFKAAKISLGIVSIVAFVSIGFLVWKTIPDFFIRLQDPKLAFISDSSAYPVVLNYLTESNSLQLKNSLHPSWLNPNSRETRLYSADAQVNIWWSSLFDMPLARGYTDPPIGNDRRGGYFWLDIALNADQLVKSFKTTPEVAKNNALFLLDWFGIKYIEAGHAGAGSYSPLSSYLNEDKNLFANHDEVKFTDRGLLFDYYLGKKSIPIRATNIPVILFTGSEGSYLATLEALNLDIDNPKIILLKGPDLIDHLINVDLNAYDGLMFYNYAYANADNRLATFDKVSQFIATGKNVFIEAGSSSDADTFSSVPKEKLNPYSSNLPSYFPVQLTKKQSSSSSFKLEASGEFMKGVNLDKFSKTTGLLEFSYPAFSESIATDSAVLIKNQGTPIVLEKKFGKGQVVWDGLDLPIHSSRNQNPDQKTLFANLFFRLFNFAAAEDSKLTARSDEPGVIDLTSQKSKGLYFSKESKDGWKININGASSEAEPLPFGKNERSLYIDTTALEGDSLKAHLVYAGSQSLNFYELKPEFTSPIFHPTNASVMGVVTTHGNFESLFRVLGMFNLNSKKVIPLKITEPLDSLSMADLKNFDMLFLYGYTYKDRQVWNRISEYVKAGGKVFIETGSDSPETSSNNLPDVFPMESLKKTPIGMSWDLSPDSLEYFKEVDVTQFGPPVLDGKPWPFSLPSNLRNGANVILSSQNRPLVVERDYGQGKVFWSGMNLAFHANVNSSLDEGKFLVNILSQMVDFTEKKIPSYTVERPTTEKAIIISGGARGVIFREQQYGWRTQYKTYLTGPNYPGYIYIPIPKNTQDKFRLELNYSGLEVDVIINYTLGFLTAFFILDYVVLNGILRKQVLKPFGFKMSKIFGKWWDREE